MPKNHSGRHAPDLQGKDFHWLEERFRLVSCTRTPESFETDRGERVKLPGNPSHDDDLEPILRGRELMREMVAPSKLPSPMSDVSITNISSSVERVADQPEQTGGLSLPD